MRMRRMILLSVAYLAVIYFCTLAYKPHNFRKRSFNLKCVLVDSATFLILRSIERGTVANVRKFSCKVPFILVIF